MAWLDSRVLWAAAALWMLVMAGGFGFVKGDAHGTQTGITGCSKKIAKLDAHGTDACSLAIGAMQTKYAQAQAKAEAAARAKEHSSAAAMARIQQTYYQQGITDANVKFEAVIAGLRDGTLRLRREWAGCEAAAGMSGTLAGVAQSDAAAERRARDSANLVRIGIEADARIRALQSVIKADRQ